MTSAREAAFYTLVGYVIFIAAVALGIALAALFSACTSASQALGPIC